MGCWSGVQGLAAGRAAGAGQDRLGRGEHRRPRGRGGTHPGSQLARAERGTPSGSGPPVR